MTRIQSFRDLDVWNKAMNLVVSVYALTDTFPRHELYGLTDQTRRAAVSVATNIAEGNGRLYRGEYAHHAEIARGSVSELVTCLEIGRRLKDANDEAIEAVLRQASAVSAMLTMLIRALRRPPRVKS